MIVDEKIMELIDSVFEKEIAPIQKALLATEIQLYTNSILEKQNQGQELPIQVVRESYTQKDVDNAYKKGYNKGFGAIGM